MHTVTEMGTSVPAFLGKLWRLVEDPETDDLICWSPTGRSFYIRNQAKFARELLPHYYKHNNMASFVRQLNMYGFHKKVSVELGGLKCDKDEMEFAHQYFCKDHPYLLDHIKRKIASNKTQDPSQTPIKPELMNRMLTEVRSMRGRQEQLDSKLVNMKRENEALWRELAVLRQKHHTQSKVVDKLIRFFIALVQSNSTGGLSMKRRFPLMIDDSNRLLRQNKISKVQQSPSGPAIHELDSEDPDLDSSDYIVAEMLDNEQFPTIESPDHQSIPDDHMAEYYVHEPTQECTTIHNSRKRSKGKKKGEETLMLDAPPRKLQAMSLLQHQPGSNTSSVIPVPRRSVASTSKPQQQPKPAIPVATVRSSKLAAMAANMKNTDQGDVDSEDSRQSKDDSLIKLENILIVPEIEDVDNNQEVENVASSSSASGSSPGGGDNSLDGIGGNFGTFDFRPASNESANQIDTRQQQQNQQQNNMTLSCVNNAGSMQESCNYRLDSMDEVDNHLDTMQSELENLREILRGEGYSIDANTLLGLFGSEDPMSFGIPVNPDLDPNQDKDEDNHLKADVNSINNNGRLMAYNSGVPSLLDFDDDILLGTSSSPIASVSEQTTACNNPRSGNDPLELAETKGMLFDSLIANSTNSPART